MFNRNPKHIIQTLLLTYESNACLAKSHTVFGTDTHTHTHRQFHICRLLNVKLLTFAVKNRNRHDKLSLTKYKNTRHSNFYLWCLSYHSVRFITISSYYWRLGFTENDWCWHPQLRRILTRVRAPGHWEMRWHGDKGSQKWKHCCYWTHCTSVHWTRPRLCSRPVHMRVS